METLRFLVGRSLALRKFAIYYNDGSVVYGGGDDDEEVTLTFSKKWLEAPSDGISHIVQEDSVTNRQTLFGNEYYYQLPYNSPGEGELGASMKAGAYLRQSGLVKFGGWTASENFYKIAKRAKADDYIKFRRVAESAPEEDTMD